MQLVSSDRSSLHCDALLELIPILRSIKTAISALKIQRQRRGGEIWLCCTNYEKKLGDINLFFIWQHLWDATDSESLLSPVLPSMRPPQNQLAAVSPSFTTTVFPKNILTILTTVIIVKVVIIVTIFHNKGPQTESFLKNLLRKLSEI